MAGSPEPRASPQPQPESTPAVPTETTDVKPAVPPSPARSDRSSDSEGRSVRKNLEQTSLDQRTAQASDHVMNDAPNGIDATTAGDQSTSGSEEGRGRLRRKRSREDFEDELEKPSEKKVERHLRKKSRDVTSPRDADIEVSAHPPRTSFEQIKEQDADEDMSSAATTVQPQGSVPKEPGTPEASVIEKKEEAVKSPATKRTHDEAKKDEGVGLNAINGSANSAADEAKTAEEPSPKRQREKSESGPDSAAAGKEGATKIPSGSSFANAAATSPFASLSPQKPSSTTTKAPEELPRTSDDKFKASGFGGFASSTASPFGSVGGSGAKSPFGAAAGTKLTSFASSTATSTTTPASGFGALGGSSGTSAFGGGSSTLGQTSGFGSGLGAGGFAGLGGAKSGVSSFATPGTNTITGLSQKPARPFGAAGDEKSDDEEEGGDEDGDENEASAESGEATEGSERRATVLQPQPVETGEEGEDAYWSGRAKLYTLAGEGSKKGWQERGVGPFKVNITKDAPVKARFVLRADGTHRLILNAALTKSLKFGDVDGKQPKDGRLLFNSPTPDGTIESHLLRLKNEKAEELWSHVKEVQGMLP